MEKVEDHTGLVYHVIKTQIQVTNQSLWDDLFQEGLIGLWKATEKYDPNYISPKTGETIQFATFATTLIRNQILMFLRKENKYTETVTTSLNQYTAQSMFEYKPIEMIETLTEENDLFIHHKDFNDELIIEAKEIIEYYKDQGTPIQQSFIKFLFKEVTQRGEGKKFGISQSYYSRLYNKFLAKIRREYHARKHNQNT